MAAGVTHLLDTNAVSDLMKAAPRIENRMAGLDRGDRVVTCTIVRGETLFGIARLQPSSWLANSEASPSEWPTTRPLAQINAATSQS